MAVPERILFVTPEIYPLIKTGGLADVSGALPVALAGTGLDIKVLLPAYPAVLAKLPDARPLLELPDPGWDTGISHLLEATLPGSDIPLLLLDCPALYDRPGGPYQSPDGADWQDNVYRFGLLCHVGALLASSDSPLDWKPDIVHCNDWQTGLIPAMLHYSDVPHARSVFSIHNLAFQGNFAPEWVTRLGLPASSYAMNGVEFYGKFSFLKAGIYFADQITTVSKTYAQEIQTAEFGYGMEGLLQFRNDRLHGIVNGIGQDWNPEKDPHLVQPYGPDTLDLKAANKAQLQNSLKLEAAPDAPVFGMVTRLTHQKGVDMVLDCALALLQEDGQIAILGSGDAHYEYHLRQLAHEHPGQISFTMGYNEKLARHIFAGSDIFLMPSRFEPCGLGQMYAIAYATPPVVRRTGGLADTVVDATEAAQAHGSASGFVFEEAHPAVLMKAVKRALACYRDKDAWRALQKNGMRHNFSWTHAARSYAEVYRHAAQTAEYKLPDSLPPPDAPAKKTRKKRAPSAGK